MSIGFGEKILVQFLGAVAAPTFPHISYTQTPVPTFDYSILHVTPLTTVSYTHLLETRTVPTVSETHTVPSPTCHSLWSDT